MRFTTSSLIAGQTYFLRAFWFACKNVFFYVFLQKRIFYVCLNTIYLSGQKLYMTLI
jgi:hypothetical protein